MKKRPASLFQMYASWMSGPPPGEAVTYFDEELGASVTRYPAGWADGAEPSPSVGTAHSLIEIED